MKNFILKEFKQGVLIQIYEAERNIAIWQHISDEIVFLETQSDYIQKLYSFIQLAAQTNFVLALSKLFDKPKNYPTQSILYFLTKVEKNINQSVEIVEKISTKRLLSHYSVPDKLIEAVDSTDRSEFPKQFVFYYREKYISKQIQDDINKVKILRDKVIAHNEMTEFVSLEFTVVNRLLKFATEIVAVFGMAYHSTIWETEDISFIKLNAERNAVFIKSAIQMLYNELDN